MSFLKKVTEEAEMWFAVIKKNTEQLSISLKTQIISTCESPIKEIVEFAHREEVDLIVVGTRGRSGIKRILLGSTASGVVTYAHCPVFIGK
jgi:nucleotide-binding universal stress UspA family protein